MALGMYEGISTPHRLVLRSLWCDLATRRRPFLAASCKCLRPQIAEVCFWCFGSYLFFFFNYILSHIDDGARIPWFSMVSDQMWSFFQSLLPEALDRELGRKGRKDQVWQQWSVFMSVSSRHGELFWNYGSNGSFFASFFKIRVFDLESTKYGEKTPLIAEKQDKAAILGSINSQSLPGLQCQQCRWKMVPRRNVDNKR